MYLHHRQIDILRKLSIEFESIKGEDLAEFIGVSTRTIRSDMKALNHYLESIGAYIRSTRNGYQLNITNEAAFSTLQKQLYSNEPITLTVPQENEERIIYVIQRLLMTNDYLKADALADELYISRSSLTKILREVKERLHSYNLSLRIRPNYGLIIMGEELKRRACISDFFFHRKAEMPLLGSASFIHSYFFANEIEMLENVVLKLLSAGGITVSDLGFENVIIHLLVSVKRIQMGMEISDLHLPSDQIRTSIEFEIINQLSTYISKLFNIVFSEGEKLYLTIHLIGNRLSSDNKVFLEEEKVNGLIVRMLDHLYEEMGVDLRNDQELKNNLKVHLYHSVTRLLLGLRVKNPLIQDILTHFPLAFEAAVSAVSVLEKEFELTVNKDETGYIAIHLQTAIERRNGTSNPKRCVIVCGTGKGSAVLLKFKLMDYFGSLLEIVDTIGYYEWKNYLVPPDIDFIISTISTNLETSIPVIVVNHILSYPDLERIQKTFFQKNNPSLLCSIIRKELLFLQSTLSTREEVIEFLSSKTVEMGLVDSQFEQEVKKREDFSPTAFGNLVALPHPLKNVSTQTFLAFCTLKKPIIWGTVSVQFVCLFSIKKSNKEDLQDLYDYLYGLLNDREKVQNLIQAENTEEFLEKLMIN
ncbi:BglG family transcription antiterminator [Neobacillus cucumis]|uniref:BglG family transcription antiterminator n=1 Tax=Neobacillus cucumis TaxID=1740721 RepID=UPI00285324BA|nr:BglG family transcription antiterminator [Neobacillus cucumis]MDR4948072.1 BglG family transcription antiterminator [Neobacillus cucumis]